MCEQREGSLRGPEERETAGDLGFELILVLVEEEISFLTNAIQIFARLVGTYGMAVVSYWDMNYGHDQLMLIS